MAIQLQSKGISLSDVFGSGLRPALRQEAGPDIRSEEVPSAAPFQKEKAKGRTPPWATDERAGGFVGNKKKRSKIGGNKLC